MLSAKQQLYFSFGISPSLMKCSVGGGGGGSWGGGGGGGGGASGLSEPDEDWLLTIATLRSLFDDFHFIYFFLFCVPGKQKCCSRN
jgi:hypothetical protein